MLIKLACYGIEVDIEEGSGGITSDLHNWDYDDPEEQRELERFNASIDAIESIILAHACAGIDIQSDAYIEGIETSVEALGNI